MIVVDVNVIAYLPIPAKFTTSAELLLETDAAWAVPRVRRSDLRNVLASHLRVGQLDFAGAFALYQQASVLISDHRLLDHEYEPNGYDDYRARPTELDS